MSVLSRGCVSCLLVVLALAGCAVSPTPATPPAAADDAALACRDWFTELDAAVDRAGVKDAQDRRIDGFPQLRVSRFAASFRDQLAHGGAGYEDWFRMLRDLGAEGHSVEIAHLPDGAWASWAGAPGGRSGVLVRTSACADLLSRIDLGDPSRRALLLGRTAVPDDYSVAARVLGLYAITRIPFGAGVRRWQDETAARFSAVLRVDPSRATLTRYVPDTAATAEPEATLARAPRNALGVPQLDAALRDGLLDRHAPVIEVATEGGFDRIGALSIDRDGRPLVDAESPTVYRRIAFVRQGDRTLVQLVYLAWFSERPRAGPFDLLAGALDGFVWRVTLDEQGEPLLYDSIHACGCYHLFFPTTALRARPAPEDGTEWMFSPAPAPHLADEERVLLGLTSGAHYLTALSTTATRDGRAYGAQDEVALRSLAVNGVADDGPRRSLYGEDGIIAGTQRGERFIFWPMGVRDAGAQRQWGHHATAFVGRRHFDDPDLIDRRFERVSRPLPDAASDAGPSAH